MSGLNFSLGGKLDPSFKASLNESVREAEAANLRIQNSLRKQISGIDKQLSQMNPLYSEFGPLNEKKAALQKNLLLMQNAQYVSAARQRMAILESERAAEEERYRASASQSEQIANVRQNLDAENAAMLRNRDALQSLMQQRKAAAAELARYNSSLSQSGGFANPRASMAADQASWAAKLAEWRALKGKTGLTAAAEAEKMGGAFSKSIGHVAGLNLMLRETLVVFREIGRGNWSRVPGSVSLIVQGFAQLKQISLLTIGAWAAAIGGIVGSVFIYLHRVKKLAEDLATTITSSFKPEHLASYLSKLEILNQLQKDAADSARQIQEAHDSVSDSMQRELDLTRSRIAFERELLELQKANALAAVKNPAEREAIEKKFSALILAKKKEERDAEVKAMKDEAAQLPKEIADTQDQIKKLTSNGFMNEGVDQQILADLKDKSDQAKKYYEQLDPEAKDERIHSADKDRAILAKYHVPIGFNGTDAKLGETLTDTEIAKVRAAQTRLKNNFEAQQAYNSFVNSGDDRSRARKRVKELEDKIKQDSDRLTKLIGTPGHGGAIADKLAQNIQQDKQDKALEEERLKRVDAGRPLNGREVTERERVGLGAPQIALLDVNRSMDRKLGILVQHAQRKPPSAGGNFGTGIPQGFGD